MPWMWAELAESGSQLGAKHTTTTMTWQRPGTTSDWITLPSYIYIYSVYAPSSAVDDHVDASLLYQSLGGGLRWLNLASGSQLGTDHTTSI